MGAPFSRLPISLCMIVKNEEKYLGACLDSVAGFVNEMIVVDTGSTDRTMDIAHEKGARVYEVEWRDDFAWARNQALEHATNPWILHLDADEELHPDSISWFRTTYPWANYDGYNITIHNLSRADAEEVFMSHAYVRFFRNMPHYRYVNRIHEHIPVPNQKKGNSEAKIIHKGYGDESLQDLRIDRNQELLFQELEEKPDDPYIYAYLANHFASQKQMEEMEYYASEALKRDVPSPLFEMSLRIYIWCSLENNKHDQFEEINKKYTLEEFPELLFFNVERMFKSDEPDIEKADYYLNTLFSIVNQLPANDCVRLIHNDVLRNAYRRKAEILASQKRFPKAAQYMEKASELGPTRFKLNIMLSQYYLEAGELEKSRRQIEKSIELIRKVGEKQHREKFIPIFKNLLQRIDNIVN